MRTFDLTKHIETHAYDDDFEGFPESVFIHGCEQIRAVLRRQECMGFDTEILHIALDTYEAQHMGAL